MFLSIVQLELRTIRKLIKMSFRIIRSDLSLKGLNNIDRSNRSAKVSHSWINVGHRRWYCRRIKRKKLQEIFKNPRTQCEKN